jgi:hypothetical protein
MNEQQVFASKDYVIKNLWIKFEKYIHKVKFMTPKSYHF